MQPESLDRLFRRGVLDDVAEDQFAFPTRVAGIDDLGNIFVFDELSKNVDAAAHFVRWFKLELRRHNGQLLHVPFVLLLHGSRHCELKEMTDCPRDDVFLVVVEVLAFLEAAERLGDVASDRRLLGDYEGFGHGAGIELSYTAFASG